GVLRGDKIQSADRWSIPADAWEGLLQRRPRGRERPVGKRRADPFCRRHLEARGELAGGDVERALGDVLRSIREVAGTGGGLLGRSRRTQERVDLVLRRAILEQRVQVILRRSRLLPENLVDRLLVLLSGRCRHS